MCPSTLQLAIFLDGRIGHAFAIIKVYKKRKFAKLEGTVEMTYVNYIIHQEGQTYCFLIIGGFNWGLIFLLAGC
jgi:hypothetical protein